ncbi:sorbosone dehydrogenase family protein [Dyadobacter sp. Leaf189]|uniref:PQQ-dependent sugar dehydrogenase n=1 Tax=Dyadobacter sp. Leaf189 TaxID=1736295 RepID=UPI0006FB44F9|nr:PQQ-dependent sugar dehydrogenase [Dyadobacter sp. Leaf189]KQS31401.1 glucose sorbosone dehydrogenase [Dyadobacter sp. Leaf189]
MKPHLTHAFLIATLLLACSSKDPDKEEVPEIPKGGITSADAFPALKFNLPVELAQAPGDSSRFYVIEQEGTIRTFASTASVASSSAFLDIKNKVTSGGERGLLGLAFHPDYKTNGFLFVNYTNGNPLKTTIARYKANPATNQADPASEVVLFTFNQPYSNHNGGSMHFGKDGLLYIATGDGGSGGDPENNAQNLKSHLGKILRVDVNGTTKGNYGIPADNPFATNTEGNLPEIYAYGLRNPWRISFDMENNRLFAGDVGQNEREEIDIITKGGNYGWRLKEGVDCYNPASNCGREGLVEPIHDYSQSNGDKSITGGYVYRGKAVPSLIGKYIYGDYVSGRIWALEMDGNAKKENTLILENQGSISSFGQDVNGEVYFLNYSDGKVMKLVNAN